MEATTSGKSSNASDQSLGEGKRKALQIEGYPVEGLSIGGHETCVIFPSLKLAFDIGRCPQRAISQDFVFISHGHMDHIGGLPLYVATRGLYRMRPPTIIVPTAIKEDVEKLFEVHRKLDQSELRHNLIGLDVGNISRATWPFCTWGIMKSLVGAWITCKRAKQCFSGEEFYLRRDLKVRAFKTYHVIQSQGYVVYSIKQKLKPEYIGLPSNEIKNLKLSGTEITDTITAPEVAFTGDTMSDFIADEANDDVLRSRILVVECTFLNNLVTVEHARDYGHIHLSEIVKYADKFQNKAILLIHFSARYTLEEIKDALHSLPSPFCNRVSALTEGF